MDETDPQALLSGDFGDIVEFPDFRYEQDDPMTGKLMDGYAFTLPPTSNAIEPLSLLPTPPPTQHKRLTIKSVISYRGALARGDALLYLPHHIRARIFTHLLTSEPEFTYIEVPDTKDIAYPNFAQINDMWYKETCSLMLQTATFSIGSDAAVFNFMVFLAEFEGNEGFENVTKIEFTDLAVLEKGVFSASAARLMRRLTGLKSVSLVVRLDDLVWTFERGGRELDIDAMERKYDLRAITQLPALEKVTLELHPFMALQKRLAGMEQERLAAELGGCAFPGLETFWGLKEWIEMKALDGMRLVEVVCPK